MRLLSLLLAGCTLPKGFRGAYPVTEIHQGECLQGLGTTFLEELLVGPYAYGSILVQGGAIEFDCEAELVGWVKPHGKTLDVLVHPEDLEASSGCTCLWNVAIEIAGLTPGDEVTVQLWRWTGRGEPELTGSAPPVVVPGE